MALKKVLSETKHLYAKVDFVSYGKDQNGIQIVVDVSVVDSSVSGVPMSASQVQKSPKVNVNIPIFDFSMTPNGMVKTANAASAFFSVEAQSVNGSNITKLAYEWLRSNEEIFSGYVDC